MLKTFLAVLLIQTTSCARTNDEHFILDRHLHIIEQKLARGLSLAKEVQ
jgi:hypothetical protein